MSSTSQDQRAKKRYALLIALFLLGILALVLILARLGNDPDASVREPTSPTAVATRSQPPSPAALRAPGIPALEAYARGASIGWQVTANPDNGGSDYSGYEIELISTSQDIRADFPGNGSGAGMYSWTFDGDPTLMARTHTQAGLYSDWVAMVLPVAASAQNVRPQQSASQTPSSSRASARPSDKTTRRVIPETLIGESSKSITPVGLLPARLIDEGVAGTPLSPGSMPSPNATATSMPVIPLVPSESGSPSPSASETPSGEASSTPSPGKTESPNGDSPSCTDGRHGNDKCKGKGSDDHPSEHDGGDGRGGGSKDSKRDNEQESD